MGPTSQGTRVRNAEGGVMSEQIVQEMNRRREWSSDRQYDRYKGDGFDGPRGQQTTTTIVAIGPSPEYRRKVAIARGFWRRTQD